jgi:hypothetical protein
MTTKRQNDPHAFGDRAREAIVRTRGGWANATDADLRRLWASLGDRGRAEALAGLARIEADERAATTTREAAADGDDDRDN